MRLKKLAVALSALLILGSTSLTALAGNIEDQNFNFILPGSGKYTVFNEGQGKWDATSTYIYYTTGPATRTLFSVHGYNSSRYNTISSLRNCTIGGSAEVPVNAQRLIRQYVNEWGYSYAFLGGANNTYPNRTVKGLWSPDSVGSYPNAN